MGSRQLASLLGRDGETPQCRIFSDTISVHWFVAGSEPGARCLCEATTKDADEDVAYEKREPSAGSLSRRDP